MCAHGCFPVHLLYIFRRTFPKNTSVWLLMDFSLCCESAVVKVLGKLNYCLIFDVEKESNLTPRLEGSYIMYFYKK